MSSSTLLGCCTCIYVVLVYMMPRNIYVRTYTTVLNIPWSKHSAFSLR